jgi:transcriptional regulator
MYTPAHFQSADRAKITAVILGNSFATLTTQGRGELTVSHLPFLYDETAGPEGTLFAHMARANSQWRDFATSPTEAIVVFQGEHGYISPTWYASYASMQHVPTWNYEAVHAYGTPRVIEDAGRTIELLEKTIRRYEAAHSPYSAHNHPAPALNGMVKGIVAFEIPVTRLEAKFKLSQNRTKEDLAGAIAGLEETGDPSAQRGALAMRREKSVAF